MNLSIMDSFHIFALDAIFRQLFGSYPTELVGYIMMCVRRKLRIGCENMITYVLRDNIFRINRTAADPQINTIHIPNIKKIIGGDNFAIGLTHDGKIFSWGFNLNTVACSEPKQVNISNIIKISCGDNHVFVIDRNRSIYAWGRIITIKYMLRIT